MDGRGGGTPLCAGLIRITIRKGLSSMSVITIGGYQFVAAHVPAEEGVDVLSGEGDERD